MSSRARLWIWSGAALLGLLVGFMGLATTDDDGDPSWSTTSTTTANVPARAPSG